MKHTYIYQGRNYISSKRASEISDYSSDYIGQLCRAGKLDCQRVGHAWFVSDDSLRSHMSDVWSDDAMRSRANNLKRRFVKEQSGDESSKVLRDSKKRISSKQAALLSGYAADYIGQLCRNGKLDAVLIGKTWFVVEESLKAHIEKIRMEEVARKNEKEKLIVADRINESQFTPSSREKKSSETLENQLIIASQAMTKRRKVNSTQRVAFVSNESFFGSFKKSTVLVLSSFILISIVFVIIVSFVSVPNSAVKQPMVASVYSVNSVSTSDISNANKGIAVVQASNIQSENDAIKASIQESFSDQVNVVRDQTGSSGIITPVFKKADGMDFMYVMVPINNNQNPP